MYARARSRLLLGCAVILAVPRRGRAGVGVAARGGYQVHNLVSNLPGVADHVDPNLVNAWGLAAGPTSPWWVADNGTDLSTLYNGRRARRSAGRRRPAARRPAPCSTATPELPRRGTARRRSFIFATEERHDPRLERRHRHGTVEADSRPERSSRAWPSPTPPGRGSTPPTSTTAPSTSSTALRSPCARRRLRRSRSCRATCAVRDPGDRRPHLRHLRQAAGRQRRRGPRPGTRASWTRSTRRHGLRARVAQFGRSNAPWGLALAPATSGASPATCWSATSATAASTPIDELPPLLRAGAAQAARPPAAESRSTACGRSSSAMAHPTTAPPTRCSSPPAPTTRQHGLFGAVRAAP